MLATDRGVGLTLRLLAACLVAVVPLTGIACGGDDESTPRSPQEERAAPSTTADAPATRPTTERADRERPPATNRGGGSKRVRLRSGATVVTPERPKQTVVAPNSGCVLLEAEGTRLLLPPTPGVRAVRADDGSVIATVQFSDVPGRCAPTKLRLTLDVNDDGAPAISRLYPYRGDRQKVRLTVPRHFSEKPDVVAASAVDDRGIEGDSVKVLITEDG
jgi:hypothetical protein